MNWRKLQNGSDIRGVAMEGIEGEPVNLTPEVIKVLGNVFVQWSLNNDYEHEVNNYKDFLPSLFSLEKE